MKLEALIAGLSDSAAAWLESAVLDIARSSAAIDLYFAAASRKCGRTPWNGDDPQGFRHGCLDDLARAAMIGAMPARGAELVDRITSLYRLGDANEKRGVLRALYLIDAPYGADGIGDAAVPLLDDALRTNDVRLIAAAVQPYGADHLAAGAWRHAVVKCVFVGVPLAAVVRLEERQDSELARMLVDLAHERTAAGRPVPLDIPGVLSAFPASLGRPDLPRDLLAELARQSSGTAPIRTIPEE